MNYSREQFKKLFLSPATVWLDVRAPVEFKAGAVPGAVNLPLITDEERHIIGIEYKAKGQEAAVNLGHRLVQGSVREAREQAWMDLVTSHSQVALYCFRGGMRSQIVQSWLAGRGIKQPLIDGGYKALRQFLMETVQTLTAQLKFEVVDGPTGAGKTKYLYQSSRPFIDLEALARHRGSAFGALPQPQPSQVDFENGLALEMLKLSHLQEPILIENESRLIGRSVLPEVLFKKMQSSPKVVIQISLEERIENIFEDYILNSKLGQTGDVTQFDEFRSSINSIQRKLGLSRASEILQDLNFCQREYESGLGLAANRAWIKKLILWYYDPLYKK